MGWVCPRWGVWHWLDLGWGVKAVGGGQCERVCGLTSTP